MAGPSNTPPYDPPGKQELYYLHAINANVSNFVSVKLSGNDNYHLWKTQMLCLMETHSMCSLVDGPFDGSSSIMKQYDSLLKGWIFGSVSQRVLGTVMDLGSAKEVWDKLEYFHAPTISHAQQDPAQPKAKEKEETKGKGNSTETKDKDVEKEIKQLPHVIFPMESPPPKRKLQIERLEQGMERRLEAIIGEMDLEEGLIHKYNMEMVYHLSKINRFPVKRVIDNKNNTVLHLAVEKGENHVVHRLLKYLKPEDVKETLEMKNVDGNTALHVAAIAGNAYAAGLLVAKHNELLTILDSHGQDPLFKAYSNLQFDTCICLLAFKTDDNDHLSDHHLIEIGVDLLVYAISAKDYSAAIDIVQMFPEFATGSDQVLMAIARTFPSGLSHDDKTEEIIDGWIDTVLKCIDGISLLDRLPYWTNTPDWQRINIWDVPPMLLALIFFLILIHFIAFVTLCLLLFKGARILGSYMNRTKKKEWVEAKKVLRLVCQKIDNLEFSGIHHRHYEGPILEAACQNAYEVVDEILSRFPQVIKCQDECGYDIIQLAVIHRSDKIYNRIYQNGEGNNQYYRTIKDSSLNNMLHLVGRLAPLHKLNRITGAALQLQRELQWREELKKFVFPAYITQENIYKETPDVVFTREHENLVKEGETWMKTTAESCSITAGLITTIVFAAAITVPGGSNQEKGTPLFTHEIAFVIFAISDAISLFTSTIALLVFLSILTARFSEQDFLVNLPRRLIIGLCSLLVSTTAMMVAFGAILFLVFGHKNPWMLVPICTPVCLTIVFFFVIQLPLILDLYRSTYVPIFGTKSKSQ